MGKGKSWKRAREPENWFGNCLISFSLIGRRALQFIQLKLCAYTCLRLKSKNHCEPTPNNENISLKKNYHNPYNQNNQSHAFNNEKTFTVWILQMQLVFKFRHMALFTKGFAILNREQYRVFFLSYHIRTCGLGFSY